MLELTTTFDAPVFAGDTIYVDIEVVDKSETSNPDHGVVTFEYTIENQNDEQVARSEETALIRRRGD